LERATIEDLTNHPFVSGGKKFKEGFEDSDVSDMKISMLI